ncbi:KH domain-containing protein [Candidatus Woesebacteria bacterium]|nr:KH domain-containing protein [Candidatus Woesebacteria bacterium]
MKIKTFLAQLCEHCGLSEEEIKIETVETDEKIEIKLSVPEDDSGVFIGHHGDSIDSIQRILRVIFQEESENKRIVLNINDYREKREDRLKDLTYSAANKVLETKEEYSFNSYLPAHERYIIHFTLAEDEKFSELESVSEGIGRNRKLVIKIKK